MGRHVLEMKASNLHHESATHMFAHCAKDQTSYNRQGAITIFMVNMQEHPVNGSVRLIGSPMKNLAIESYVLTSPDENTS